MLYSVTDEQFGQHLYTLCQNVIHEFIVLGVHCLEGREQALQRLIEHQMVSHVWVNHTASSSTVCFQWAQTLAELNQHAQYSHTFVDASPRTGCIKC